jgi:hypothetical protein
MHNRNLNQISSAEHVIRVLEKHFFNDEMRSRQSFKVRSNDNYYQYLISPVVGDGYAIEVCKCRYGDRHHSYGQKLFVLHFPLSGERSGWEYSETGGPHEALLAQDSKFETALKNIENGNRVSGEV